MKKQPVLTAIAMAVSLSAMLTFAAPALAQSEAQPIYGSQLMNDQERQAHRTQMRSAGTAEERERIRAEHHERMQVRAKEQGMTLPEVPPAQGTGQGMMQGQGQGMQQGQGMKQGKGQNRQNGNTKN